MFINGEIMKCIYIYVYIVGNQKLTKLTGIIGFEFEILRS